MCSGKWVGGLILADKEQFEAIQRELAEEKP